MSEHQTTPEEKEKAERNMSEHQSTPEEKEKAESKKQDGNTFLKEGNFSEAIACYVEAIQLDDSNAVYYYNRAVAYDKLGEHKLAIEDCQKALKRNPLYDKAYARMGLAYTGLGDYWEAAESFREALEIDSGNKDYLTKLEETEQKIQEEVACAGVNFGSEEGIPDFSALLRIPSVEKRAKELAQTQQVTYIMSAIMSGKSRREVPETWRSLEQGIEELCDVGSELVKLVEKEKPELVEQLRSYRYQADTSQQRPS